MFDTRVVTIFVSFWLVVCFVLFSHSIQIKQLPSIQIKQMLSCRKYRTDASKRNDASKSSDFDHAAAATPQEHM